MHNYALLFTTYSGNDDNPVILPADPNKHYILHSLEIQASGNIALKLWNGSEVFKDYRLNPNSNISVLRTALPTITSSFSITRPSNTISIYVSVVYEEVHVD